MILHPLHLIAGLNQWLVIQMRGRKKMIAPNNFFINFVMLRSLKATYNFS